MRDDRRAADVLDAPRIGKRRDPANDPTCHRVDDRHVRLRIRGHGRERRRARPRLGVRTANGTAAAATKNSLRFTLPLRTRAGAMSGKRCRQPRRLHASSGGGTAIIPIGFRILGSRSNLASASGSCPCGFISAEWRQKPMYASTGAVRFRSKIRS